MGLRLEVEIKESLEVLHKALKHVTKEPKRQKNEYILTIMSILKLLRIIEKIKNKSDRQNLIFWRSHQRRSATGRVRGR